MKGQLPKAYLRIDPNLDQTHPNPAAFLRLLCAAARQPKRGRFKTWAVLVAAIGKREAFKLRDGGDVKEDGESWIVDGWDIWQEGDMTVGERMRRYRNKHVTPTVTDTVTVTGSPSEALGVRRKKRTTETELRPPAAPPAEFPSKRAANVFHKYYPDGVPPGAMFKELRPLVLKHTWDVVEPELDAYLEQTGVQFQSWPKFAQGFGTWCNGARPPTKPTNPKAAHRLEGKNAMIAGGLKHDGRGLDSGDERAFGAPRQGLGAGGAGEPRRSLPEAPPMPDGPPVVSRGRPSGEA